MCANFSDRTKCECKLLNFSFGESRDGSVLMIKRGAVEKCYPHLDQILIFLSWRGPGSCPQNFWDGPVDHALIEIYFSSKNDREHNAKNATVKIKVSYRQSFAKKDVFKLLVFMPTTILQIKYAKIKSTSWKFEKFKFGGSIFLFDFNIRKSDFIYCLGQIKFSIKNVMCET